MNRKISQNEIFSNINDDILCHLFKYYVNLKEQLNLTRVCKQFHDIIVRYIWKKKYEEVKVIVTSPNYIITNIINHQPSVWELVQECRTFFNDKQLVEFLHKNNENIQRFSVCSQLQFEEKHFEFPIKYCSLINLLDVQFCGLKIYEEQIKELSTNCPKLEKLSLDQCYNRNNLPLEVGKDIAIAAIENLENLKCLEINDATFCMRYEDIFAKLKIQQIKLNVLEQTQFDSSHEIENAPKQKSYPCQQLTISGLSQISFDKFTANLLNNLENLTMLTINGCCANNKFFKTLAESCCKLTYLKLQRFQIVNFSPLQTLSELRLEDGFGLTWQDLKQILTEMKLKAFSSAHIMYAGSFQCFTLAPNLEHFEYTGSGEEFIQLFEMNKENLVNLTTLIWHQHYLDTSMANGAKYCRKLQALNINYNDLLFCDLSNWKQLQKLHISSLAEFIWSTQKLLQLLQHPSLTHLSIFCPSLDLNRNDQLILKDMDYKTNLLLLDIPIRVFKIFQDFWLNLVEKNRKLNLLIFSDYKATLVDYKFLSDLIRNPKFPKRLKSIKMHGFNIDYVYFQYSIKD